MKPLLFGSLLAAFMLILGSIVPFIKRSYSERSRHRLMALGSGVLLGTAFLHLIPEASKSSPINVGYGLVFAFLLIFAVEQIAMMHACQDYYHDYVEHQEEFHSKMKRMVSFIAFLLHSLLDGVALAAGFATSLTLGIATSLAILIHQFPIGVSLTSIFLRPCHTNDKACLNLNKGIILRALLTALSIPLGAILSFPWLAKFQAQSLAFILGFSAGSFVYIGATDILPEIHNKHDAWCFICFTAGIVMMFAARFLGE